MRISERETFVFASVHILSCLAFLIPHQRMRNRLESSNARLSITKRHTYGSDLPRNDVIWALRQLDLAFFESP